MEPGGLILVLALALPVSAPGDERPGAEDLAHATRLAELANPEQARARVELAIAGFFAARAEAADSHDDRFLRDAGALAYKLRALPAARRAWDAARRYRERALAPDALELQNARGNVSWIGEQLGLVAEARALEEQILESLERSLPADHEALVIARANLGDTLLQQGEPARALELFQKAADVRRAKLPAEHPARLRAELDLACGEAGVGAFERATAILEGLLSAAPDAHELLRLRALAALVLVRAVHGDEEDYAHAVERLGRGLEQARPVGAGWRERELRRAELRPFDDLLLSAAWGLGTRRAVASAAPRQAKSGPGRAGLQRVERTRIEGQGTERRVVAEERLAAWVGDPRGSTPVWIDLGGIDAPRALAERRFAAARAGAARAGDAQAALESLARAVFEPLARALGDPPVLSVEPDDVLWSVPFEALDLRAADGRRIPVAVGLPGGGSRSDARRPRRWLLLCDPAPHAAEGAGGVDGAGGAAAYLGSPATPAPGWGAAWAARLGLAPHSGAECDLGRLMSATQHDSGAFVALAPWSAPAGVPCLASPRPLLASTPLAAAMAREDVVGGSSPADLCGLLLAGYADAPRADGRVPGAPRVADLAEQPGGHERVLVIAAPPPAESAAHLARALEAFARTLALAGFTEMLLAVDLIVDPAQSALPSDLEVAVRGPAGARPPAGALELGPWSRVRVGP